MRALFTYIVACIPTAPRMSRSTYWSANVSSNVSETNTGAFGVAGCALASAAAASSPASAVEVASSVGGRSQVKLPQASSPALQASPAGPAAAASSVDADEQAGTSDMAPSVSG